MSSIVEVKVNGHTYLYESQSYREQGKPKNRRKCIGKVDAASGKHHYKPEYIEKMRKAGTPVEVAETDKVYSASDLQSSAILEAGLMHLLTISSERIGLTKALAGALPRFWKEVFMLACHLVRGGGAFHHVSEWIERADSLPVGSLSSQRISELLAAIAPSDRDNFYRLWCAARSEEEYLALDITSISSYSELIDDVEWGYNRDHEELAQINMMMLMGQTSRLPIYQTVYSGSIRDVSTLDTNMGAFDALTGGRTVTSVTDKGFYSLNNMRALLDSENRRFIAAVPFTSAFAKRQVDSERKDIDCAQNTIAVGGQSMRAVSKIRALDANHKVHTHVFYSAKKALGYREDLLADVAQLKDEALSNPKKYSTSDAHARYLNIRKSSSSLTGWTVSIKEDVIQKTLGYTGWLVLISNCVSDPKAAIDIYRAKDIVEKGFMHLKDDLDLGRLRVHSQERMQNKVFVGFIALILLSHVHAVMAEKNLYRDMTALQLIRALSKQRVQVIDGTRIVFPATKQQKAIYAAFDVTPLA